MPVFNPFQPWTYQPPKPGRKAPVEAHPPIIGKPVTVPVPNSVIEEVLREYREAMRRGEMPIAYGPGGLATAPKPSPTPPPQPQPPRALPPTPHAPTPTPPQTPTPPIEVQPPTPPRAATPTAPAIPATAQPTPPPFIIETELGLTPPPTIPNIPPHILLNLPELGLTPEELARLLRRTRLLVPA